MLTRSLTLRWPIVGLGLDVGGLPCPLVSLLRERHGSCCCTVTYLALSSSLLQAPAGESGTGNSRRETPYSPSNQQVRLPPGQAIWGKAGRRASNARWHRGRRAEEAEYDYHP